MPLVCPPPRSTIIRHASSCRPAGAQAPQAELEALAAAAPPSTTLHCLKMEDHMLRASSRSPVPRPSVRHSCALNKLARTAVRP